MKLTGFTALTAFAAACLIVPASGIGDGGEASAQSRAAYNQPPGAHQQQARQPNLGGGFLELLITGRDPTPRTHAAPPPQQAQRRQAAPQQTRAHAPRQAQAPARTAPQTRNNAQTAAPQRPQRARQAPRSLPANDAMPARIISARTPPTVRYQNATARSGALPSTARASNSRVASLQASAPAPRANPRNTPVAERFRRTTVDYTGPYGPGTIVVDTSSRFLYFIQPGGKAIRYGVGVGRQGFSWRGTETVTRKAEWPDWRPPESMRRRQPELPRFMAGGPDNPLGARALYLGNTLYRIHGTNEPHTIGQAMSSGCIRMMNEDVKDLYERVRVGSRVVVM
ncbi:L,D-transpeptidase family protein [Saliniramus sp.]|uniref:L,D-transpeptidase family protein n=1 Tax=Saliniramus sp. TaxID=2986772 RepID=UPI002C95B6D5|nr:L,D-transpeptidase family protein [Saliniramus sp.]HMB09807.1 L,D-transpeptidase family protein [Saliniramus sp.]